MQVKITDFIAFAKTREGQDLQTKAQHKIFTVRVTKGGIEYTPSSTDKPRFEPRSSLIKTIEYFSSKGSFKTSDYQQFSGCSSYTLALIDLFQKSK